MKVLVACEESQRVCIAFREKGHEAYSCDIQECSGGHPEWHIVQDVLPLLNGRCTFLTSDGQAHKVDGRWDLIIAHPPCTYLTIAGACNIPKHPERIELGFEAVRFFEKFLNADCEHICIENPPPMKRFSLPLCSQIIQPYMFGDPYNKRTCLWLLGLPFLIPTHIVKPSDDKYFWYSHSKGKKMSMSKCKNWMCDSWDCKRKREKLESKSKEQ